MTDQLSKQKPKIIIIFLTVFIYLVGFGIIIPMIPVLGKNFGASALEVGLLMSVFSLMQFIFSPFWGRISDRIGRRPVLLGCLLGEGLSYILFAYARNLEVLFLARALAGFFGASISTASAYISDITPPNERSKGMALIGAAFGLGFIVGPALGGILSMWGHHINPEPFFDTSFASYWVAALCLCSFIFGLKFLTESLKEENRLTKKSPHNRLQTIIKHFQKPLVGNLILVFGLSSISMSLMESTLVLFVGEKFNWTIREISFGFAYIGLTMTFTQGFLVRKLIPSIGERKVLVLGLSFLALGLVSISLAFNPYVLAVSMTILGLGNGLTNPSILGSISLLTPVDEQGVTLGVTQSLASLGRIIGPAIGGYIFGKLLVGPYLLSGLLAFCGLVIVLYLFNRLPQTGKQQG